MHCRFRECFFRICIQFYPMKKHARENSCVLLRRMIIHTVCRLSSFTKSIILLSLCRKKSCNYVYVVQKIIFQQSNVLHVLTNFNFYSLDLIILYDKLLFRLIFETLFSHVSLENYVFSHTTISLVYR